MTRRGFVRIWRAVGKEVYGPVAGVNRGAQAYISDMKIAAAC